MIDKTGDGPLAEHEEALMPEHRKLFHIAGLAGFVRVGEADKMEHKRVDDLVRKRVLLVQKDADEQRVRA